MRNYLKKVISSFLKVRGGVGGSDNIDELVKYSLNTQEALSCITSLG